MNDIQRDIALIKKVTKATDMQIRFYLTKNKGDLVETVMNIQDFQNKITK